MDHADVQTQKTALHLAAFQGHLPVVQVLLDRGAKIDAVDAFGWTPLMFAAHAGHFDVASALVAAKANITLETPKVLIETKTIQIWSLTSVGNIGSDGHVVGRCRGLL